MWIVGFYFLAGIVLVAVTVQKTNRTNKQLDDFRKKLEGHPLYRSK